MASTFTVPAHALDKNPFSDSLVGQRKMKTLPYLIGVAAAGAILFFAYTDGGYHSRSTFYLAAIAASYVVFSSVALIVSRCGTKKSTKGWAFFGCGIVLLFSYLPSLRFIMALFYLPRGWDDMRVELEIFYYAPMIVSALCIYRGISLWADDGLEQKKPNQPPQRNAGSRPSSGDTSASETPSSLGPRG